MTVLLDGRALAARIRAEVAAGVAELLAAGGRRPGLAVVLAGDNAASQVYVGSKVKACEGAGILSRSVTLPASATEADLLAAIDGLNRDDEVDGILVQLPLPAPLAASPAERRVLDSVSPDKDVDGFHPVNVGRLWLDEPGFAPATPSGIVRLLREHLGSLAGREAVVVGRSAIVGKPMAGLLLREHCTVTVCHSRTPDLAAVARRAEVLIAAVGRAGLIGPEHVREGAIVVDVGINRVSDPAEVARLFPGDAARAAQLAERGSVLVGDVDFARVAPRASAITPVPGGVGPLTVAQLLVNTLAAARARQGGQGQEQRERRGLAAAGGR